MKTLVKDKKSKYDRFENKTNGSDMFSVLNEEMGFAVKESFNLLRTNLMLSFTNSSKARVIGISSSVSGEGKSFVACNIARSLAEMNDKVLLLEGDLRRPSIAKKLNLEKAPGVSNVLTGSINDVVDVLQRRVYGRLDVITSGDIPPNPSELLGSQRMRDFINLLSDNYNYIIVDLPPITAVPDPLIFTKLIHGIVLVARHEYTDKRAVEEVMRQLKMVDAKILGFVYNGIDYSSGTYSKKYYKKKKYIGYGSGYYTSADPKKAEKKKATKKSSGRV